MNGPALACFALGLEALLGYPDALFGAVGHPVTWMGGWLAALEQALNARAAPQGTRRSAGALALALLLGGTAVVTVLLADMLSVAPFGVVLGGLLAASLPAQRSLATHVGAVAEALEREGLAAARAAVARIVGRNPAVLDEAGVARAAIESLAENFSDGVVAPALWLAVLGLPGGALYKAINTADSMIGHRTPRYEAFGWAAARLDDLVNWPAARLAALWLVLAARATGADWRAALGALRRDAGRHRSPNAGWPEAAMAGALDLRLGGPRVYGETLVEDAFMGTGRADLGAADIRRALRLYRVACLIEGAALLLAALAVAALA